jgi:hypothetical protein
MSADFRATHIMIIIISSSSSSRIEGNYYDYDRHSRTRQQKSCLSQVGLRSAKAL